MNRSERIVVVGAGIMGPGIAQGFAQAGYAACLVGRKPEALESARARVESNIAMLLDNGLVTAEQAACAKSRLTFSTQLAESVADADLIIESIPENADVKREFFARLDDVAKPEAIFASNTSAMPISTIASFSRLPERVVGAHYWNPPHLIPLVEVVTTPKTAGSVLDKVMTCLKAAGKAPVHVRKDVPGYLANRLQHALMREAMYMVEEGIASVEDIDAGIKNSFALRLLFSAAFEQRDLNGLETQLGSENSVFPDLCNVKEPPALLRDKVARGELGLKVGKGYYDWAGKDRAEVVARKNRQLVALLKFLQANG